MTVLLLMCQILAGNPHNCMPPGTPRWQAVQPSWEACMAESDRRNTNIRWWYRGKPPADHWEFFCHRIAAVPA